MTASDLKSRTVRDLAVMARKKKVPGWHAMKKDELVKALLRRVRAEGRRRAATNGHNTSPSSHKSPQSLEQLKVKTAEAKDLTFRPVVDTESHAKDRLVVMGARPLLAPRLLGTEPQEYRASEGSPGPVLARSPPSVAGL